MSFTFADPTQLWLEISPKTMDECWQQSQRSQASARWRAYLNHLGFQVFLQWLRSEWTPEATAWPNAASLPSFWELVNGTAIGMGKTRLVLIPTEAIDEDEIRVPQEWVDIPEWVADYYLATQINPDEKWVRIWGYTTHQQLKTKGYYSVKDRSYCLEGDDVLQDLNVLWVARQLCREESTREAVAPLPSLSAAQAENLLQRLGNPEITFPRLAVPFPLWGALLKNEGWRQRLYQQRSGKVSPEQVLVQLNQWFENIFEAGWQSLETLFAESPNLVFSFQRASSLSEPSLKRVKLIDLGDQLENQAVLLLVAVAPAAGEKVGIRVQLHPEPGTRYLPAQLRLTLLTPSGESLKSVEAGSEDNYIQLQRFRCARGFRFSLQITLDDLSIMEDFVV